VSPSSRTDLAAGPINGSDRLTIELVEPPDMPAFVAINWPPQSSVIDPKRFRDSAATVVRLFSEAHIKLASIKARRPL
jgi:hypothetical protein